MQNFFELFNLPQRFDLDEKTLDTAYRSIQRLVHPDRFVTASEAEKRAAVQYASLANDGYQTLKDPLKRAVHLCALNGVQTGGEQRVQMDPMFLMEQMEWRERLEDAQQAKDTVDLQALADEQSVLRESQMAEVKGCLETHRFEDAAVEINKLMFLEKFGGEVTRILEGLTSNN